MDDSATLVALVRSAMAGPPRPVLAERSGDAFVPLSNEALLARVEAVALALRARGIAAGDRVALMAPNRIDWIVANLGILSAGAVAVPLYPAQALDQVEHILRDSAARLLFIDNDAAKQRLLGGAIALPAVVVFDGAGDDGLAAFERAGNAQRAAQPGAVAAYGAAIAPEDLAVLIYTSGTTGVPKGVMLSHRNIATTALAAFGTVADVFREGDPVVSVLPWAHIYEHTNLYGLFFLRTVVHVCHAPDGLLADLQAVRPRAFFAVPRIFERVVAGILGKAAAGGGAARVLVPWALATGRDYMRAAVAGQTPSLALRARFALARALVLRKLRPALGLDRLEFVCSGSAALHLDIALTLLAAGIVIYEGYGLTECSPVVSVNTPAHHKFGTVGLPLTGVDVRLGDDGELLVRGPNVMQGYYHDDAATAATIRDGWLATGDIATIDADGYIRITDRKKELFKTSGGKYIAPSRLESALLRSPFVGQVMVVGSGRPYPLALVSPNWPLVRGALRIGEDVSSEDAAAMPSVRSLIDAQAKANTADLAPFEQVRYCAVLPRDLSIERQELSPTLKVRRRVVEERYAALIEATYAAVRVREAVA